MMGEFGELLRHRRLAAGIRLRQFAAMVGIKASNLSTIEHGRRDAPEDPEKLRVIANALGIVPGLDECRQFYDAARRPGGLPADVRHMADRPMVCTLLRAIDNRQLDDAAIARLIEALPPRPEVAADGGPGSVEQVDRALPTP